MLRVKYILLILISAYSGDALASNFGQLNQIILLFTVATVAIGFITYQLAFKSDNERHIKWLLFGVYFIVLESLLLLFIASH